MDLYSLSHIDLMLPTPLCSINPKVLLFALIHAVIFKSFPPFAHAVPNIWNDHLYSCWLADFKTLDGDPSKPHLGYSERSSLLVPNKGNFSSKTSSISLLLLHETRHTSTQK